MYDAVSHARRWHASGSMKACVRACASWQLARRQEEHETKMKMAISPNVECRKQTPLTLLLPFSIDHQMKWPPARATTLASIKHPPKMPRWLVPRALAGCRIAHCWLQGGPRLRNDSSSSPGVEYTSRQCLIVQSRTRSVVSTGSHSFARIASRLPPEIPEWLP